MSDPIREAMQAVATAGHHPTWVKGQMLAIYDGDDRPAPDTAYRCVECGSENAAECGACGGQIEWSRHGTDAKEPPKDAPCWECNYDKQNHGSNTDHNWTPVPDRPSPDAARKCVCRYSDPDAVVAHLTAEYDRLAATDTALRGAAQAVVDAWDMPEYARLRVWREREAALRAALEADHE